MRTVNVGVGHQNDLVIAQLGRIEVIHSDARAKRRDHGPDLVVTEHLVVTGFLDVENLALQRKDRLIPAMPALFGRAASRFALDNEDFRGPRVFLLAIGELAGQAPAIESALAAGQISRLARGFPGPGSVQRLLHDLLRHCGVHFKISAKLVIDKSNHLTLNVAVEFALGLTFELRLRQLYADHGGEALANVVAAEILLDVLEQLGALAVSIDRAREPRPKAA